MNKGTIFAFVAITCIGNICFAQSNANPPSEEQILTVEDETVEEQYRQFEQEHLQRARQRHIDAGGLNPESIKLNSMRQVRHGNKIIEMPAYIRQPATKEDIRRLGITDIPIGIDAGNLTASEIKTIIEEFGNDPARIRMLVTARMVEKKLMERKK